MPATLKTVRAYLDSTRWEFSEIVVVNDGSRDSTADVARDGGARVVENPGNRGKGYAAKHGVLESTGDWILITDADLSSPITELDKLWNATEREHAQIAIGSRAVNRALVGVHQPFARELAGRFFNAFMRVVTGLPFRDTQCGFKLFEGRPAQEIFKRQQLDGFGFDVEVLYIAAHLGYRALEIPVRWDNVLGTKVSMWRGAAAFLDPIAVRWNGVTGKYR